MSQTESFCYCRVLWLWRVVSFAVVKTRRKKEEWPSLAGHFFVSKADFGNKRRCIFIHVNVTAHFQRYKSCFVRNGVLISDSIHKQSLLMAPFIINYRSIGFVDREGFGLFVSDRYHGQELRVLREARRVSMRRSSCQRSSLRTVRTWKILW